MITSDILCGKLIFNICNYSHNSYERERFSSLKGKINMGQIPLTITPTLLS